MIKYICLLWLIAFCSSLQAFAQDTPQSTKPATVSQQKKKVLPAQSGEVLIGKPEFIPYSRAFSLLDGLFQDVSAMQINQLNLEANRPNATNVDAIMQQFQASLQFSQLAGIQNAAAAQQSAAYSASMVFENQLINQEAQLVNLSISAQQQITQAQNYYDSIPTEKEEEKEAARIRLESAKSNLTLINNQINTIKALRAGSLSNTTPSSFSVPSPSPISLPSPMMTPSIPSAVSKDGFAVSFPPSKQMENQVNLLWERLAHLLNTLAQSDDPGNIYLIKFNTGIAIGKDKKKYPLLSTQYSLTCSAKDGTSVNGAPIVLDLFPRMAAVNIADQKYRDNRFGIGALLSFFSVGINASYNREHLRITQALNQSAYITGFGIQTDSFGWVFGKTLGEDILAPGPRMTFALVSLPEGCSQAKIKLVNAVWDKSPNTIIKNVKNEYDGNVPAEIQCTEDLDGKTGIKCNENKNCVKSISYTPVEFSTANSSSNVVTVNIALNENLDREQTVSVNGIVLKRARDSFGRATSTAVNVATGLLQASALDAGTWFPVSNREMILNLNPSVFSNQFPRIFLNSPKGSIDISNQINNADERTISGRDYICPSDPNASCFSILPALGRPQATTKRFQAARWIRAKDHILFKAQDVNKVTGGQTSGSSLPQIQVIRDLQNQPWSGYARVVALQNNLSYALRCEPFGEYLDCKAFDDPSTRTVNQIKFDPRKFAEYEIFDSDFAGSSVKGMVSLQSCSSDCQDPLVISMEAPRWNTDDDDRWDFRLLLANVKDGWTAYLGQNNFSAQIKCSSNEDMPCSVTIPMPKSDFATIKNSMSLRIKNDGGQFVGTESIIGNLRFAVSPIISSIDDDKKHFTGVNLVWDEVSLDKKGRKLSLGCANQQDCTIRQDFNSNEEGYLHFVAGTEYLPFLQLTDKGFIVVAPVKPKPKKGENSQSTESSKQPATLIQIDNSLKNVLQVTKPE